MVIGGTKKVGNRQLAIDKILPIALCLLPNKTAAI